MIEANAVPEVPDGVLDLGVAAVVGLQLQGVSLPVGDEGVITVFGREGQLGSGCGLDPSDDEPHRSGIGFSSEGGIDGLCHVGAALHPVGNGPPIALGDGLYEMVQAAVMEKRTFCWRQSRTTGWV